MSDEWLHDLARRLVARDEVDATELVAHQADFDHAVLFDAADAAARRGRQDPRERSRWESIRMLLEDAAVFSLRWQTTSPAPSVPENSFETIPLVPHVTIDLDAIKAHVEVEDDFFAFFKELVKATSLALTLAGETSAREELRQQVKVAVDEGSYSDPELLLLVAQYITLR